MSTFCVCESKVRDEREFEQNKLRVLKERPWVTLDFGAMFQRNHLGFLLQLLGDKRERNICAVANIGTSNSLLLLMISNWC